MRFNKYENDDRYQIFNTVSCEGKTVRIYIDKTAVFYLVNNAAKNKGGQSVSGPMTARILK